MQCPYVTCQENLSITTTLPPVQISKTPEYYDQYYEYYVDTSTTSTTALVPHSGHDDDDDDGEKVLFCPSHGWCQRRRKIMDPCRVYINYGTDPHCHNVCDMVEGHCKTFFDVGGSLCYYAVRASQ